MMQRVFDVKNAEDMALLWSILPIEIKKLYHESDCIDEKTANIERFIKINWHDKKEITRPIQEATEADIGKLCMFWDGDEEDYSDQIGLLTKINPDDREIMYTMSESACFVHCRRLTKQEIEELC